MIENKYIAPRASSPPKDAPAVVASALELTLTKPVVVGGGGQSGAAAVREVEDWAGFVRAPHAQAPAAGAAGAAGWCQLVGGTMPEAAAWVAGRGAAWQFVDAVLRGASQVFLINNPLSGALMLAAIGVGSWWQLCGGLLSLCAATAAAYELGLPADARRAGLFGYNGVLTGSALALFHFGGDADTAAIMPQVAAPLLLCGAFSAVATAAVGRVTSSLLGLAPFTFPFQLTTWMWLLAAQSSFTTVPLQAPAPALRVVAASGLDLAGGGLAFAYDVAELVAGSFRGVAQVFLIGDLTSGILMVLAIGVSSPLSAAAALLGSAVGTFLGAGLGVPPAQLYAGLYGYNASLAALCVGGLFFVLTRRSAVVALFAAAMATVCSAATDAFLAPAGMPALTFPFCLITWLFVLLGQSAGPQGGLVPLALSAVSTAEEHRRLHVQWMKTQK